VDRIKIGDIVALDKQGHLCIRPNARVEDAGVILLPVLSRVLIFADSAYAIFALQEDRLCIGLAEYGAETIPDENHICVSPDQLEAIESVTVASNGAINQAIIKDVAGALKVENRVPTDKH
jgi:hypothetical protein